MSLAGSAARTPSRRRRGFGLDPLLPSDPTVIEAQILRRLAQRPEILALRPDAVPDRPPPPGHRAIPAFVRGAPDLLLLRPGGTTVCLKIRTQAEAPSADERAFGDLCRDRDIPFAIVRSLEEAKVALARWGIDLPEDR